MISFNDFINEGNDIDRLSKEYNTLVKQMKDTAALWKSAEADKKDEYIKTLKNLTARKRELEGKIDDAISSKDKNIQLVISED